LTLLSLTVTQIRAEAGIDGENMEKVTTKLKVTNLKVIPFEYVPSTVMGEAVELRASGTWRDELERNYPVSLNITVYPGHPVIPALGDEITITVERSGHLQLPETRDDQPTRTRSI
jgi:hypothetical protein